MWNYFCFLFFRGFHFSTQNGQEVSYIELSLVKEKMFETVGSKQRSANGNTHLKFWWTNRGKGRANRKLEVNRSFPIFYFFIPSILFFPLMMSKYHLKNSVKIQRMFISKWWKSRIIISQILLTSFLIKVHVYITLMISVVLQERLETADSNDTNLNVV